MMYQVNYLKPKKKGFAKHSATFLDIEGAILLEKYVQSEGAKQIQILVK